MPITIGDGGTNRAITSITIGDGGTNRTLIEVWIGDGGTNRLVFQTATVQLAGLDPSASQPAPGPASATYSLTSGGSETATGLASQTWLLSGLNSDYDCRVTVNSGSLTSGTTGTWLNLGTTRSWNLTRSGPVGISTCDTTVEIRNATTLVVLATATVIFTAETA